MWLKLFLQFRANWVLRRNVIGTEIYRKDVDLNFVLVTLSAILQLSHDKPVVKNCERNHSAQGKSTPYP